MTDRKKPGWAFWTVVGLPSLLVLYVLGAGPAVWIVSRESCPGWLENAIVWA
jgi:hypothetical protein